MKRYQKHRLLLDAAGVAGLLLLGLSLWFGHPRPAWRASVDSQMVSILGLSPDGQSIFTMKDYWIDENKLPKGPIIDRWNVQTGELQKEFPLQLPEKDRASILPVRRGILSLGFSAYIVPESHWLVLNQYPNSDDRSYSTLQAIQPHWFRLYDLTDGTCVSDKPIEGHAVWGLPTQTQNGRIYGVTIDLRKRKDLSSKGVCDLGSGERVHAFEDLPKRTSFGPIVSSDKQFLLMLWQRSGESNKQEFELEAYRIGSWEKVFQATLQGFKRLFLFTARPDRLLFHTLSQGIVKDQLVTYRFDPERGIIELDDKHPCHGLTVESGWFSVRDKYLLATVCKEPNLAWRQQIDEWLGRIGLHFPRIAHLQDYRVYDLDSGKLLRQLSSIYEFDSQSVFLSNDSQNIIGVEEDNQRRPKYLTMFHIPHYLWEPTWNILFYVAVVLLVLWPFRFLGKRIAIQVPPVPPPEK